MPVVITQEEKALPYAKYFYQDLAPIPQEKLDIWHGPMADPALATPVERRNDFLEEGKVALRNIRRDAMDEFKKKKKASEITEDDLKELEKELQDLTDKRCKEVDELTAKKEQELMTV